MRSTGPSARVLLATLVVFAAGCQSAPKREPVSSQPGAPPASSGPIAEVEGLEVKRAPEEVVVTAWAEPKHLPPGGGVVQILVRTQKRGGAPFSGIEVRLKTTTGSLYSNERVLMTDGSGMTRDRLTARKTAEITMNAGGTRFRFVVPVLPGSPD